MKFIRVHGRVVPLREKSGAPKDSKKKRYPGVKRVGAVASSAVGVGTALVARKVAKFGLATSIAFGAAAAYTASKTTTTRKAKGESNSHAAKRISNYLNARKKK